MEKQHKLSMDDLIEMLREDLDGDVMPYYWSIPLYAPVFPYSIYQDNMDKMLAYCVKKYGGKHETRTA